MKSANHPAMDWYLTSPLSGFSQATYPKIQSILSCIGAAAGINLTYLKALTFTGIPEEFKGLRALVWKVLLNYLPLDIELWESRLRVQRDNYYQFREEFLGLEPLNRNGPQLSRPFPSSTINSDDEEIWFDIEKDIKRTRPDMHFFFLPTDQTITVEDVRTGRKPMEPFVRPFNSVFSEYYSELADENAYTQLVLKNEAIEKHADVMARILFLYAKLNAGIRYVQGMNELLAPIYYCFAQDSNPYFQAYAEADSFYCFTLLMSEVRDPFVKSLDGSSSGLQGKLEIVNSLLRKHAPNVSAHLDEMRVLPHFYALKWVMLLFTQDFDLPEILRLWDSLLSDEQRFRFFYYVCVSMVKLNAKEVLKGDFGETLSALQHPTHLDVEALIEEASELMARDTDGLGHIETW